MCRANHSLIIVPEDFDHIVASNFASVGRAHSLPRIERLLNAAVAAHMPAREHYIILVLLARHTNHLTPPLLILQRHVILIDLLVRLCDLRGLFLQLGL